VLLAACSTVQYFTETLRGAFADALAGALLTAHGGGLSI